MWHLEVDDGPLSEFLKQSSQETGHSWSNLMMSWKAQDSGVEATAVGRSQKLAVLMDLVWCG